jgi:hypothetical protein
VIFRLILLSIKERWNINLEIYYTSYLRTEIQGKSSSLCLYLLKLNRGKAVYRCFWYTELSIYS